MAPTPIFGDDLVQKKSVRVGVRRTPILRCFGLVAEKMENPWKVGFLDDESESAKISVVEGVNHTDFFVRGHHQKSVWVGCSRPKKSTKNESKYYQIQCGSDFSSTLIFCIFGLGIQS